VNGASGDGDRVSVGVGTSGVDVAGGVAVMNCTRGGAVVEVGKPVTDRQARDMNKRMSARERRMWVIISTQPPLGTHAK
jgi:hypothetical protein